MQVIIQNEKDLEKLEQIPFSQISDTTLIIRTIEEFILAKTIKVLNQIGIKNGEGLDFVFDYSEKQTINHEKFEKTTGYHDFCALISNWIIFELPNCFKISIYLDSIGDSITGTDMEFFLVLITKLEKLQLFEISTGGLRAMKLWEEGYYRDSQLYIQEHDKNENKGLGVAIQGLNRQWEGILNPMKFRYISENMSDMLKYTKKLTVFELHLPWCSGFEAWEATLSFVVGFHDLSKLGGQILKFLNMLYRQYQL
ncbi:hypothetical protein PPERSA_04844 [Pseudocohnilembus persalinus]|uniref:Uncharacterized protein n=1 Tax=Pseudocohnilembus persalinus TaxID=266149 RepID=A0A0V0QJ36_PSEPJ|nr:hypothetical protein PPERSA_04844 [Pseudocohnilembus persalinus]|eukprot:KRX02222.1 hypothetical protein PPERSA_04844 [Pseudocohnilembus persalinus]